VTAKLDWRHAFIGVFLAVQVIAPLHYYLLRDDKNDERFAWRMFSPTRMLTCDPTFLVDGQPARLLGTFHEAWVELARRGRFAVLEAMGARLCAEHPKAEVRLDLRCRTVDGEVDSWGGSDLCKFPEL
jgi:hypothetical protein